MFIFTFLAGLFRKPAPPEGQRPETPEEAFRLDVVRRIRRASVAMQFPASTNWYHPDGPPSVLYPVVERTGEAWTADNSPLHNLMAASHPDVPAAIREAMWADPRFLRIVRYVFAEVAPYDVNQAALNWLHHGYWNPMCQLMEEALRRDLVGGNRVDVRGTTKVLS